MPNDKINIVRPDGSVIRGTREELANLQFLNKAYHEEGLDETVERVTEKATEEYYDTPGKKIEATIGGLSSGITLGADEFLMPSSPEEIENANQNAGYRLGGEIGGAILGSVTGVGPAGLLTKGANAAARGVGGGLRGAIVGGVVEGAGAGLQQTISTSTLSADPLTAESILTGVGYGSLFGGALGGTFNIAGKGLSGLGNKIEPSTVAPEFRTVTKDIKDSIRPIHDDSFKGLSQTVSEFSANGARLGDDLEGAVQRAADDYSATFPSPKISDLKDVAKSMDTVSEEMGANAFLMGVAQQEVKGMKLAARAANKAVDAGDFQKAAEKLADYKASISKVASITGFKAGLPEIPQLVDRTHLQAAIGSAGKALEARAAARTLDDFPKTASEFARMSPNKAEKLFAAIDNVLTNQGDEIQPFRAALQANLDEVIAKSGVKAEGNTVEQLKELYRFGKVTPTQDIITTIEEQFAKAPKSKSKSGFAQEIGDHFAAKFTGGAAGYAVAGPVGGAIGYYGTRALLHNAEGLSQIKNAVQNKLSKAAKGAGKVLQSKAATYTAAKLEPLYLRIDGTQDTSKKKSIEDRAKDRITEIVEAAPAAKEILYKAVEPLLATMPDVAAAIHNSAVLGFNTFLDMIPKDPGVAVSGGKSLWKPNSVQAVQFSKMHDVFMAPLRNAVEMIEDFTNIDPVKVNTLRAVFPEVYQYVRGEVLQNVDFSKLNYREQAKVGILLDYDVHSSFSTMNIAESQRIFMETPQPPESGGNRGGTPGNSGGKAEPPTAAQSLS